MYAGYQIEVPLYFLNLVFNILPERSGYIYVMARNTKLHNLLLKLLTSAADAAYPPPVNIRGRPINGFNRKMTCLSTSFVGC